MVLPDEGPAKPVADRDRSALVVRCLAARAQASPCHGLSDLARLIARCRSRQQCIDIIGMGEPGIVAMHGPDRGASVPAESSGVMKLPMRQQAELWDKDSKRQYIANHCHPHYCYASYFDPARQDGFGALPGRGSRD